MYLAHTVRRAGETRERWLRRHLFAELVNQAYIEDKAILGRNGAHDFTIIGDLLAFAVASKARAMEEIARRRRKRRETVWTWVQDVERGKKPPDLPQRAIFLAGYPRR